MTVYVDELFLENFIMNYIILYMTGYFSKIQPKWYKLIPGAVIGAIYVIVSVIYGINIYNEISFKLILSVLIILISFSCKSIKEFIKTIIFFYLITFAVGGASVGLAYFLNFPKFRYGEVLYVEEFPIKIVIVSIIVIFILVRTLTILLKDKLKIGVTLINFELYMLKRKTILTALLDTGNNVEDPCSKGPVIFIEIEALKPILPENVYELFKNNDETIYEIDNMEWKTRIRVIPLSTVNKGATILMGFKPDKVIILMGKTRIERTDVIIGICDKKLSKNGEYSALIGNNIFKNTKDKPGGRKDGYKKIFNEGYRTFNFRDHRE